MALNPPGRTGARWAADNQARCQSDLAGFLALLVREHGDIASFDLGAPSARQRCVVVASPAAARELLTRREPWLRKPEFVKASNRGHWGDGLTTLEGPAWRERRGLLQPSFRAAAVAARMPVVAEYTQHMLRRWPREGAIDLIHELRLLTARIAARTVFDADIEGADDAQAAARAGLLSLEEAYGETFVGGSDGGPWVMVRPRAPPRIDGILRIIDARLAGGPPRGDVLSALIQAGSAAGLALTRDQIVGELVQMLFAGHLTIPQSLANFWRDLAEHGTAAATLKARPDAAHCLAWLKESLRMHAPAPVLYREVERPFEIAGFRLERDQAVWVPAQLLHEDARCFSDPLRFDAERFMPGRARQAQSAAYLPFGAGARTCIGSHQALQQMALIARLVTQRFALTPQRDTVAGFYLRALGPDGSECFKPAGTTAKADHNCSEEH